MKEKYTRMIQNTSIALSDYLVQFFVLGKLVIGYNIIKVNIISEHALKLI